MKTDRQECTAFLFQPAKVVPCLSDWARPGPCGFSGKSSALRLRYFPEKPCAIRHGTVRQARNKISARRAGNVQLKKQQVMSKTKVVNIHKESCDVYIGRAGRGKDGYFGNPFRPDAAMARGDTLERYRKYFYHRLGTDEEFRRRIGELQGKTLGCFCKPNPCHGDIIKEYLDRIEGNAEEAVIGKTYWKGCAYPVREIHAGNRTFRMSVESLCDELVNDMRNGVYEAMEANEEIDGYCTDEELCTLTDAALYEMCC